MNVPPGMRAMSSRSVARAEVKVDAKAKVKAEAKDKFLLAPFLDPNLHLNLTLFSLIFDHVFC